MMRICHNQDGPPTFQSKRIGARVQSLASDGGGKGGGTQGRRGVWGEGQGSHIWRWNICWNPVLKEKIKRPLHLNLASHTRSSPDKLQLLCTMIPNSLKDWQSMKKRITAIPTCIIIFFFYVAKYVYKSFIPHSKHFFWQWTSKKLIMFWYFFLMKLHKLWKEMLNKFFIFLEITLSWNFKLIGPIQQSLLKQL